MNNPQYPVARRNGLVVQEVPDEVLVYDLDTNKAHCLNKAAAAVWKSCDGTKSVSDIARVVEIELGSNVNDDFVWLAIDQLGENNLLDGEMRSTFAGQTRREVLRKIGLASVIAIPMIASLAAPKSVMAATSCLCNVGNGNTDCITQGPPCGGVCNSGICGT
jgi:hypothetical protein